MTTFSPAQRTDLEKRYGKRVRFQTAGYRAGARGPTAMPAWLRALLGRAAPDAVVSPATEAEVVDLMRWAAGNRIPLTLWGRDGAASPARGVAVDFSHLNGVLRIDAEAGTATAQAGAVWRQVDERLADRGLMLRLYPATYPVSTVGGWLAQSGAGYGSLAHGWFRDNVVAARAVSADGEAREYAGAALNLLDGARGYTGLITQVTLRVQPRQEWEPLGVGCPHANSLKLIIKAAISRRLPVWSMSFMNAACLKLLRREATPVVGNQESERPWDYVLLVVAAAHQAEIVRSVLADLLKARHGVFLPRQYARKLWQDRFELVRARHPELEQIPADFVVPLDELPRALFLIDRQAGRLVIREGQAIRSGRGGKPEVAVRAFIPAWKKRFHTQFLFGLPQSVARIAGQLGGRPYGAGGHFTAGSPSACEPGRCGRRGRLPTDPLRLLNPKKPHPDDASGRKLGLMRVLEPFVRRFGNALQVNLDDVRPRLMKPDAAFFTPRPAAEPAVNCAGVQGGMKKPTAL